MSQLSEKLQSFNDSLTEAEKTNFKLLLGLAAGGLAPEFSRPNDGPALRAFNTVSDTLMGLQPYSGRISQNGLAYRGRPPIMTDRLLESLQQEARDIRPGARRNEGHFLGCGAPIANSLALDANFAAFVRSHAGDVRSTGIASFLFYDEPGQGIKPHIDTDVFSLNVLLMLEHRRVEDSSSCLVLFPPHGEPERLDLAPGEIVIMFAGSITHGRERVRDGESVSILTFGFQPVGD